MAFVSIDTTIDAIVAKLGGAVPTYRGGRPDVPKHTGVERFVWVRYAINSDEGRAGQSAAAAGYSKPIGADAWTCEVECRATTLARAEHLRAALITAARDVTGRNAPYGDTEIEPPNADEKGWIARVSLVISRPLLRAELPIAFADELTDTVTIQAVAHDPTDAAPDGILEVGEG